MDKNKLASKIFSSVAKVYDKFLSYFTFGAIHKWQYLLISKTPIGKNILDVGTGTGEIINKISKVANHNDTLIGVDLSSKMLEVAKNKNPNAIFLIADAENLPFKDSSLDNIFFSLTFRHLDLKKALKEVSRIIKQEGYISILDIPKPNSKFIYYLFIFLLDILFRPIGRLIFSKQEYDYFVHSIKYAPSIVELRQNFENYGFIMEYQQTKIFGLVVILVFRKHH